MADVNSDGREDVFVGGAAGQASALFLQTASGTFQPTQQPDFQKDKSCEDVAAAFFDADGDRDLDLYVGSGSNEFSPSEPALDDRLYLNDGRGQFRRKIGALPEQKPYATACVRPADVDGDGDMDVFVGMRLIPGHYGQQPSSFILENNGTGEFTPAVQRYPALSQLGMVTDAQWADADGDRDLDLVVVGDWEPVRIFTNENGQLTENQHLITDSEGWWNCIQAADLDQDGDLDFILGNWGQNTRFRASAAQPLSLYISDFDQNGRDETILCQYNGARQYPLAQRNDLVRQIPILKKKYLQYSNYAGQTIEDIFSPEQLKNAIRRDAKCLETSILWNEGQGQYKLTPLPPAAQLSPVFAIAVDDFTGDGLPDLLLGGNHERCKPETGTYLASRGCLLAGNGKGEFQHVTTQHSGLVLKGPVRAFATLGKSKKRLLVANNDGPLQIFNYSTILSK
jgi:hypothetical protein